MLDFTASGAERGSCPFVALRTEGQTHDCGCWTSAADRHPVLSLAAGCLWLRRARPGTGTGGRSTAVVGPGARRTTPSGGEQGCLGVAGAARLVRRTPLGGRPDLRASASAGLVLAALAEGLPVRWRTAVSCPTPDSDQSRALASGGKVVSDGPEQLILTAHLRGRDGMCVGCRAWWSRLVPYPCWQVDWATSRQARASVARFLGHTRSSDVQQPCQPSPSSSDRPARAECHWWYG